MSTFLAGLGKELSEKVGTYTCEYDELPLTFPEVTEVLANLGSALESSLETLYTLSCNLRDYLTAKVVAGARADFRAKLSEGLAQHASFAHRLCKPTMPVPDCPADALRKLGESK